MHLEKRKRKRERESRDSREGERKDKIDKGDTETHAPRRMCADRILAQQSGCVRTHKN